MYAVASLLNPAADKQTKDLWRLLENSCGLSGISMTPLPHFSWQAAVEYDARSAQAALKDLAEKIGPFKTRTAGLGMFTGPAPVLYLTVVKNECLFKIHKRIWDTLKPYSSNISNFYSTELWIPHITIAYKDLNPTNFSCAVKNLLLDPLDVEILVDNVTLLYHIDDEVGIKDQFYLRGKD
jgi:2'-5' RNA ligase